MIENILRIEDYATSKFLFSLFFLLQILSITSQAAAENEGNKPSSPFDFIKNLQGCRKGEKGVKGLHQLKQYLKYFGYIDYQQNQNLTAANQQDVVEDDDDDDFDDILESAIKIYQMNYHLNVTGTLDANTVYTMTMARCGVPDIMNGTNWMRNQDHNQTHHRYNSTNSIDAISNYNFFPGNPKWPASKNHLTYAFYGKTNPLAMTMVTKALNRWASVTHFSFSQVQKIEDADLKIGFFRRNHDDGNSFDGRGGIMAHAFAPPDGRLHFDGEEAWSIGPHAGYMDVETVALHEIGHLLGLGHSSVQDAIMWPSLLSGKAKNLHEDDINGIRMLYNDS